MVLVVIAIALSLCAGRLVQLQGFESSAYAAVSAEALVRKLPLLPARGELTDRNGVLLATTEPAVAVTADPTLTRARAWEFAERDRPAPPDPARPRCCPCCSSRTAGSCT